VDANEVLRRAQAGDQVAARILQNAIQHDRRLLDTIGDLAVQARVAAIGITAHGNAAVTEAITAKVKELQSALLGKSESALDRLLVDRVLVTWLHVYHADMVAAQSTNVSVPQAEYQERRQERAQRQHLAAIRTLAQVRRLGVALQINIGAQQVNVVDGEIVDG
jgi:hypothetical protein